MAGNQDAAFFDSVILRPVDKSVNKRSLSTTQGRAGQDENAPANRSSKRSASAERGGRWVAAPAPKPKENRFVALPFKAHDTLVEEDTRDLDDLLPPLDGFGVFSPTGVDLPGSSGRFAPSGLPSVQGRILVLAACEAFDPLLVTVALKKALPFCVLKRHPEVLHMEAFSDEDLANRRCSTTNDIAEAGDVFIFEYGVVILWGLDEPLQDYLLRILKPVQIKPLRENQVYREYPAFHYTADKPPHIQNDCITIPRSEARNPVVKMAISHALAQSAKLHLYETFVTTLVEQLRHLPESLAKYGEIRMSRKRMAQLQGQVFILKSEVNLLSSVLGTPDFFWSSPDALRTLYNKVCEYNELSNRVDLVNSRIMLMQSMLHIWSDHKAHHHLVRLDRVVIVLLVIEVVIAGAEVLGFFLSQHS